MNLIVLAALACAHAARAQEVDTRLPAAPLATRPGGTRLSGELRDALPEVHAAMRQTELGRRLLAVTEELPLMERSRTPGPAVRYLPGDAPALVVDRERAPWLDSFGFEALFVAARTLAAAGLRVPLHESEAAAQQAVLDYALQKAAVDKAFAGRLKEATRRAEPLLEGRRALRAAAPGEPEGPDLLFPGRRPEDPLDRVAFDLLLFTEDPNLFYALSAQEGERAQEAVLLSELEDFLERHEDRLAKVSYRALGRYALVDGRVYPGRVARAAQAVGGREALARVRERLGLFRSVEGTELLRRANQWVRDSRK